jgi:hypothetical protein
MQRLTKRQVYWLALVLAFLVILFFLDFPTFASSQNQAPIASGTSVTLVKADNLKFYAFPIIEISQTTLYRPTWPAVDPAPRPEVRRSVVATRSNSGIRHNNDGPSRISTSEVQSDTSRADSATSGLRAWTKEEVQELIETHSLNVGLDPARIIRIATCESGLRWDAKNRSSSASGIFQYLSGVWGRTLAGRQGTSVFDADANIRMAVSHMAVHGYGAWLSSQSCWNQSL